jgi:hypothetical protein
MITFMIVISFIVKTDRSRIKAVQVIKRVVSCTYVCEALEENPPLVPSELLRLSSGLNKARK